MLLIFALLLVAWLLSRRTLAELVPSESVLAVGLVAFTVLVLFQMGELG